MKTTIITDSSGHIGSGSFAFLSYQFDLIIGKDNDLRRTLEEIYDGIISRETI